MKSNTQKLLVSMYPPSSHATLTLTQAQVGVFLPELTVAGLRSALYRLIDKGLVKNLSLEGGQQYYLTSRGSELVSRLFPALDFDPDQWQGKWLQVVFLAGPSHDRDFRLLRSMLNQKGAHAIARGVYLLPELSSDDFIKWCKNGYQDSIQIQRISSWEMGGETEWIIRSFELESITTAYSGVSKEIERLLGTLKRGVRLTQREKMQIPLVFDRFWEVLGVDCGITPQFINDCPHPRATLGGLQHLVQRGFSQVE